MATSAIYDTIMDALARAVDEGLNEIAAAAQEKAPVRRIFQSPSKRIGLGPDEIGVRVGSNRRGLMGTLNTSAGSAFRWPEKQGRFVFNITGGSRVRGTRAKMFEVSAAEGTARLRVGGSTRGRPNSYRPVINTKELGKIGGDLNALSEAGQLSHELITGFRHGKLGRARLSDYLTARGRYELKHGRGVTTNAEGQQQVGGTLRASIHSTGVQRHGDQIYGYVEAYASDPGKNFNYAWAQEMGTGHNRPQPFLRPALREQRERILTKQKNVLRQALRTFKPDKTRGAEVWLRIKMAQAPTGLTGLRPFLQHLDKLSRQGVE